MAEFLDVIQWKKTASGKVQAVRIGWASPRKDGQGFEVSLDALPMPNAEGCKFSIVPRRAQPGTGTPPSGARRDDFEDSVPF